jgi:hypothetical protein
MLMLMLMLMLYRCSFFKAWPHVFLSHSTTLRVHIAHAVRDSSGQRVDLVAVGHSAVNTIRAFSPFTPLEPMATQRVALQDVQILQERVRGPEKSHYDCLPTDNFVIKK